MGEAHVPFAELLGRSCFSFLEGASHPEEMVRRSSELGLDAMALCDRDGLYGSVRAHGEAKKCGARLIVGAEISLEFEGDAKPRIAFLVQDHDGYSNLCRLLTLAHADHEKGTAGVSIDSIASCARGLVAIAPLDREAVPHAALGQLRDAFADRFFVAAYRHLDPRDGERVAAAEDVEAKFGVHAIATARPLYHHPSRKPLADVVHCIRHKTTLDRAASNLSSNAEAVLRSGSRMLALFRDRPAWVARTVDVAASCDFSLDRIRYRFPSEKLVLAGETSDDALRRAVEAGKGVRYPNGTPSAVQAQIEKELALIAKLDVAAYFLSVHQIVGLARARKILCQGRGSAANSAVCFVLGITAVDPERSNLLFERFLSAERVRPGEGGPSAEPPDIDVDFEHERREEVIQDIYALYGRDRAAMVSEIISYRGKSAIREVGKAFGLALDQVDRLSSLVVHFEGDYSSERVAEAGLDPRDGRIQSVVRLAGALEGFPRHLSIHVGGFVLSAEPLDRVAPIEPARMEGRTVIPWDKDDLDELGFFKIDVLGLGMLTAIRKTLELVHEEGPFDPLEAFASIPAEDPAVYAAVQKADTIGVFQIESRAQMAMLPRLRPATFYDLVIEVAIVRPGPIQGGMVHPYLRRRTGEEKAVSPHPCLDAILDRTLGVPLFQEQVMQIAMVGAGYSPGEADQLRRDMAAWKKHGRLERHHDRLLRGFERRGISSAFGEKLYQQVQGFGEYGFPESHAASFALLVYASSWLKVHHPAAFVCALLNSQPMGFYSASSLVQDAQRHGVEVRPVCIAASLWDNTLEDEGRVLRLGLRQVKGVGEGVAKRVEAARAEAPFSSLADVVRRAHLKKNDVEALAEAGVLAALVPERRDALFRARAPREDDGLFDGMPLENDADAPKMPPILPVEQLVLDYGRVGLSIDDHPMRYLREAMRARGVRRAADLAKMRDGASVTVAGLVIGRQRPATASGVTFVTLEDETGMMNLVVKMDTWQAHHAVARFAKVMLVHGRIEREGEVVHVLARTLERLEIARGQTLDARSRDFH